jgi:hypothetical protein
MKYAAGKLYYPGSSVFRTGHAAGFRNFHGIACFAAFLQGRHSLMVAPTQKMRL